jgi:hypothetical protein
MAKKITKSSTKKIAKPTVKAEPKKLQSSTAKVKNILEVDSVNEIKIGKQISIR